MKRIENIVLPLDGSLISERAAPFAACIARPGSASLHLVRAAWLDALPGVDATQQQVMATREAEDELDAVRLGFEQVGLRCHDHVVWASRPADAICEVATRQEADLLVMATHGRSGIPRMISGSVAEAVVRRSRSPVLLVPALCERSWEGRGASRVVVALDGSDNSMSVLAPALQLAAALGAELLLVRAVPPSLVSPGDRDERALVAVAETDLDAIVGRLGLGASPVVHVRAIAAEPVPAILELAREPMTVAVAMATHGRTGLTRLLMGSVTAAVLHRIPVPLLVVRQGFSVR